MAPARAIENVRALVRAHPQPSPAIEPQKRGLVGTQRVVAGGEVLDLVRGQPVEAHVGNAQGVPIADPDGPVRVRGHLRDGAVLEAVRRGVARPFSVRSTLPDPRSPAAQRSPFDLPRSSQNVRRSQNRAAGLARTGFPLWSRCRRYKPCVVEAHTRPSRSAMRCCTPPGSPSAFRSAAIGRSADPNRMSPVSLPPIHKAPSGPETTVLIFSIDSRNRSMLPMIQPSRPSRTSA